MATRTPYYRVELEGRDITGWVEAVTVAEDDRQANSVTLRLQDPRMIYGDALFEGSELAVDMGYAGAGGHALMLRAILTKVEMGFPASGMPSLTLKGEDGSIRMALEERNRIWRDLSVTDIVRTIADEYAFAGVEAQLDPDPRIGSRPLHQDGKTDLAFLQELAGKYHAKCFLELDENDEEVLYFIPERRVLRVRRADRLALSYRVGGDSNLKSFSPRFDSSFLDRHRRSGDLDSRGQAIATRDHPPEEPVIWELDPQRMGQASAGDREIIEVLYERGAARKRELQAQLGRDLVVVGEVAPDQGELDAGDGVLESRQLGMSASGSTLGNIWLRANSLVEIGGVSRRFSGEWYVKSATHKIDRNGYSTDFRCVR